MGGGESMNYNELAQNYIELVDNLRGMESELEEMAKAGDQIPEEMLQEIITYKAAVQDLQNQAAIEFNKLPKEVYEDGWKFWMEEDKQMREEKYGKPDPLAKEMTLVYFPDLEEPLEVAQIMDYKEFKKITGQKAPVEFVRLPNPAEDKGAPQIIAIVNEEGLLEQLPLNRGNLVGNIIIAMIDPEDEEEICGFRYVEHIEYAKLIMNHFFPRATEETKYPDPTPQFFAMDDQQFQEYMRSGKLPNQE